MTKNSKNKQNKETNRDSYMMLRYMRFLIYFFLLFSTQLIAEDITNDKTRAQAGDRAAQFNLGLIYHKGQGIKQDYKQAFVWYSKAAESGHAYAQNNLGFMYNKGEGVIKDYVQAHKWMNIASQNGDSDALEDKNAVQNHMTKIQIEEAELRAKKWLRAHMPQKTDDKKVIK
jgi:uncharacterized protein